MENSKEEFDDEGENFRHAAFFFVQCFFYFRLKRSVCERRFFGEKKRAECLFFVRVKKERGRVIGRTIARVNDEEFGIVASRWHGNGDGAFFVQGSAEC